MKRTLRRLKTDYLDVFYLHDVEFVAAHTFSSPPSINSARAIRSEQGKEVWGLKPGDENKIWGDGDHIATMFKTDVSRDAQRRTNLRLERRHDSEATYIE